MQCNNIHFVLNNFREKVAPTNKSCSRYLIIIVVIVAATYIYFTYFNASKSGGESTEQKAVSSSFKVRIIPASLDDEALNLLPKDTFSYLAMIDAGDEDSHFFKKIKIST